MEKRNSDGLTEKEFLEQYRPGNYKRPSVTADILIITMNKSLNGLRLLLIQRKNHPYIDCWALPGGFINIDEAALTAAGRELEEETGLKDIYLEQLCVMSEPHRDPRMRVIDIAYIALLPEGAVKDKVKAGDDAKDAVWFDIEFSEKSLILTNDQRNIKIEYLLKKEQFKNGVLSAEKYIPVLAGDEALAFDHIQILLEGLNWLQNKAVYSDIVFNLIPKEFTMEELQTAYETISGKKSPKSDFINSMSDKITPLNKFSATDGGKAVYTYRNGGFA